MALTKVSRGLLSTGIVDNSNATAITLNADESVTLSSTLAVTGEITAGSLLTTGAIASTAVDGTVVDRSGNTSRFVAGRSGGNYAALEMHVAGASGVTKRFSIDYDSTTKLFAPNGTSEHLVVTSAGNVGIGTASPSYQLDLKQAGTYAASFENPSDDSKLLLGEVSGDWRLAATYGSTGSFKPITFWTSDQKRLTISASGSVDIGGVGNISPYGIRFAINGTGTGGAGLYFGSGVIIPTDNTPTITDANVDLGASNYRFKDLYLSGKASMTGLEPGQVTITSGSYFIGNTSAGYRFNNAADTLNLMILKDNGTLLVGCTGIPTGGSSTGFSVSDNGGKQMVTHGVSGTGNTYVNIYKNANGTVGGIRVSGSQTFFDGSSDQRLKDNIVDAPSASEDIDAIQVRSFNWKADNEYQKYGMIAQELATVAPIAVYQPEDPEEMQAVDYSKLVPMLVKEIQSLRSRVAELENN